MTAQKMYRIVIILVTLATMAGIGSMTGCTPPAEEEVQISPERQKAIQDSLKKVWERQMLLSWSLGYENYKNKQFSDAIPHFWKAAELDTVERFPLVYHYLGDSYYKLNVPDSAEIAYRLGIENYPEKAYYHRDLGYLLVAKGETEEAVEAYQRVVKLDEDPKVDDFKVLGNMLIQQNRNDEAIGVYKQLVELEPDNSEFHDILSRLYKSTGDEDEAIQSQIDALASNPENTAIMFSLGETFFKRGEYEEAIKYYNMLLESRPEDAVALEYVASSYQNLGQYRPAIDTWEKVLALKPDHKKALCEMATCYREIGQLPKARSVARQALNIDSDYGLAYIVIGEVYESAVSQCMDARGDRKIKFDDKLIYKLAYDQYVKARNDMQFADRARSKMNYIQPDIPTTEDLFMHQDVKQARDECYSWIY